MLKKKAAVSDIEYIEQIIRKGKICRLGLIDRGFAYIVPLNFGYESGCLYFHMGSRGRKIDLIIENPAISFEIDCACRVKDGEKACDWSMMYQSVMGQGVAEFIQDRDQKRDALNCIMRQYSGRDWTFPDEKLDMTTILKVEIRKISARSNQTEESV